MSEHDAPVNTGLASAVATPTHPDPVSVAGSSPSVQELTLPHKEHVNPPDLNGPTLDEIKAAVAERERGPTLDEVKAAVAERERKKREFVEKVLEARKPPVEIHKPQPIAPRVAEQTAAEMREGARQNERHEAQKVAGPLPPRPEGTTTPVFRPADFVPNMNQGQNGARGLT